MAKLDLSNESRRTLKDIVSAGFTPTTLQFALNAYLGRNVWDVTNGGAPFPYQVLDVINAAEREWWTDELLFALRAASPRNAALYAYAEGLGLAPRTANDRLEKLVTDAGFLDLPTLIEGLTAAEARLCKVEVGRGGGTGFLVGADLVLTNHHVVAALIAGEITSDAVRLRFDYRELLDGSDVNPGTVFRLDGDTPVLCCSPPSPLDADAARAADERGADELDFALLQVAEDAGQQPVGAAEDGEPRGWFGTGDAAPEPDIDDRLLIVQHPAGQPIAVDVGEVAGFSSDRRRIRYTANTRPGSSGSPCFDADMRVVALHHAGDPADQPRAVYNAGIPIGPIRARLHADGFTAALTGPDG